MVGWTRSAGGAVVRNAGGRIPLPRRLAPNGTVAEADRRPGMADQDHALRHLLVVTAWCYQVLHFDTVLTLILFVSFYSLKVKVTVWYLT